MATGRYLGEVRPLDWTITQFLEQFILFEEDNYLEANKANIQAYIKKVADKGQRDLDNFIKAIGEIRVSQKLENAPFALLALCPAGDRRTSIMEDSLKSCDNCVAMLKWLGKFGTISTLTPRDRKIIEQSFDYIDWNESIPIECWDGNIESSIKAILQILKDRAKSTEDKPDYLWERKRNPRPANIVLSKIQAMSLNEILSNIDACIHVGFPVLSKLVNQKVPTAGFVLPIQFLEAICLISETDRISRSDREKTTAQWSAFLSPILEAQLAPLTKMKGEVLLVLDWSGSMEAGVEMNGHYCMNRQQIAILSALCFQALCENNVTYLTAENSSTTIKKVELPFDIWGAYRHAEEAAERMGCGGINTHRCLTMIKNELKRDVDLCFVFSDSGDGQLGSSKTWPNVEPIRLAKVMVLTDAAWQSDARININSQWDAEILGFSNYGVEFAYSKMGVQNPSAKSSDFSVGSKYRVSF